MHPILGQKTLGLMKMGVGLSNDLVVHGPPPPPAVDAHTSSPSRYRTCTCSPAITLTLRRIVPSIDASTPRRIVQAPLAPNILTRRRIGAPLPLVLLPLALLPLTRGIVITVASGDMTGVERLRFWLCLRCFWHCLWCFWHCLWCCFS